MKIFVLLLFAVLLALLLNKIAFAHTVFAPDDKTLRVQWAVLQAKPGKFHNIAEISSRTVSKSTQLENGTYSLYGAISDKNHDLMRILEVYEDDEAYRIHTNSEGFNNFVDQRAPYLENLTILPVTPIVLEQKKSGTGRFISMTIVEVNPEQLNDFKALITREMTRSVAEVDGVLGMFATAETGDKAFRIHTMEIYTDKDAYTNYLASEKYNTYRQNVDALLTSRKVYGNLPGNVTLSDKGLHLDPNAQKLSHFSLGNTNDAYAQFFDGQSYLALLSREQVFIANVTFEPGCRNHWHIHHAKTGGGQILIVTHGRGYYQEWGKPARELKPGDVVNIPANVKHWHGAAKDSWFQHLALEISGQDTSNEWCEAVSPEDYATLR